MFSIIIPVHNHPEFLAPCIRSIQLKTRRPYKLTIVDDGSDKKTADLLSKLRAGGAVDCLLRNEEALGFTAACNRGIRALETDYYCLLNSDTEIGTSSWNNKITAAMEPFREIGLASVLSNNAINQSIPAPGPLLPGYTPDTFAAVIEDLTENRNPISPLIHGFCYTIKKSVIEKIGLLDGDKYPHYGSEDDFTMKAAAAGFKGIIVDSVFIYHYNRGSYRENRAAIVAGTVKQFTEEWGAGKVRAAAIASFAAVQYLRLRVIKYLQDGQIKKLFMFLAHGKDGQDFYLGPDGLPISFDDMEFFVGIEAEGRIEAASRAGKYKRLSGQEIKLEYQMHPLLDTEAREKLRLKIRNYLIQKNKGKK